MSFGHLPNFLWNKRTTGMDIGIFGVVLKTFCYKALFPEWRFLRNEGEWAERVREFFFSLLKIKLYFFSMIKPFDFKLGRISRKLN